VQIAGEPPSTGSAGLGTIEIEFAAGARMRISGAVDPTTLDGGGCCAGTGTPAMIPIASGVKVWIATGHTDMRRGMNSLALLVQEAFKRDPHGGDPYVFRGRSGSLIKILWHDGLGMSCTQTRCIHTTPPSASVEDFGTIAVLRVAARSTRRFHRLHCLRGGFDAGISYR
jgi:hypothetical protein